MSSKVFLPGIAEFDEHPIPGAPAINDTYRVSLSRFVLLQDQGVTHFYGCQLDLDEDKDVWMSPVEVDDGESFSYFQILYVNTTPQEAHLVILYNKCSLYPKDRSRKQVCLLLQDGRGWVRTKLQG